MKRNLLFLLLLCAGAAPVLAQQEMSAFTSTGRAGVSTTMVRDYQSLGINPANLGMIKDNSQTMEKRHVVSFGIGETAISVHSDALAKKELRENLFSISALQGGDSLDLAQKAQAALDFADAGIQLNADVLALGLAIQPSRKVGGFAIGVRDRFSSSFQFNTSAADILFNGYNAAYFDSTAFNGTDTVGYSTNPVTISGLFNGSRFSLNWYRELHFAYGRVIVDEPSFKLYAGAGAKYLMGVGYMDVDVREGFNAYSALGPVFNIDYGNNTTPSAVSGGSFTSVGSGLGIDAGLTVSIGEEEEFKFGISVTDIGSMTWNGNVYSANDTIFNGISDNGIDSYNLVDEVEEIGANEDFFQWEGEQELTVQLPTMMRIGASYRLHRMVELSADAVMPFNSTVGNFDRLLFAVGADFRPVEWFRLSSGFSSTKEYGVSIPIGAYFSAPNGMYEMGIASRDAITFFTQNTPTLSVAMGLLRFKF